MQNALLAEYKKLVDQDIQAYGKTMQEQAKQYGEAAQITAEAFVAILTRGGKRIRGCLVLTGYAMCGGTDRAVALQAARAIEIIQAYMLIQDDIQDKSSLRRGGPSAHHSLQQTHKDLGLQSSAEHFGLSLALNAAGAGNHAAQSILASLPVDPGRRLDAIIHLNDCLVATTYGQSGDIYNESAQSVTEQDITNVMIQKTAYYTAWNPLVLGMLLARTVTPTEIQLAKRFALEVGQLFQLSDDYVSTFAGAAKTGKNPRDDLAEGKRTMLVQYSLDHAGAKDAKFLKQCLGTSLSQESFERCKKIMQDCGAVEAIKNRMRRHTAAAGKILQTAPKNWEAKNVAVLNSIVEKLLNRTY